MKIVGNLILFVLAAITFSNCTNVNDPGITSTNLDSVEALVGRTWKFQSVTMTQDTVSATTSNCAKTQLASAGFRNTNWQLADEQNITFTTAKKVNYYNICTQRSYSLDVTTSANEDGTVNFFFTDPKGSYVAQKFVVNPGEINATQFTANLINEYEYRVVYVFTRE